MKEFLESLNDNPALKKQVEAAINTAVIDVAKASGQSVSIPTKNYAASGTSLGSYTLQFTWTVACCGSN